MTPRRTAITILGLFALALILLALVDNMAVRALVIIGMCLLVVWVTRNVHNVRQSVWEGMAKRLEEQPPPPPTEEGREA